MSKTATGGMLSPAEHAANKRAAQARKRVNRGKPTGATGRNPHVGTGIGAAKARYQAQAKAAENRQQAQAKAAENRQQAQIELIDQITTGAVEHFTQWVENDTRAKATWTEKANVEMAREAVSLAFGETLDGFDAMLDMLPKGTTHRSDVKRAVILAVTTKRNKTALRDSGITLAVEGENWFSALRDAMDRSRKPAVAVAQAA